MSTEQEQVEILKALVARRRQLLEREFQKDLQIIRLKRLTQEITDAEAALEQQRIIAAYADILVETATFREQFCDYYAGHQPIANALEAFAEIAFTVITSIDPIWAAEPVTASMVAALGGAVILKKTADVYCSGVRTASSRLKQELSNLLEDL